ncbi:MAG: hypothetical protein ACK5LY_00405 [Lachnospirales bacterium]
MTVLRKRQIIFFIGITINAFANALIVKSSLASSSWGIAALNISSTLNISFGIALAILSTFIFISCQLLERKKPTIYDILGLICSFIFSFYIDFFSMLLTPLPSTYAFNLFYTYFGIIILTYSIAIYLKANYIILPMDSSMKTFSDHLFKGNMTKGGYLVFTTALLIALIAGLLGEKLVGFNIYSVIIYFIFSPLISFFMNKTKNIDKFLELDLYQIDKEEDEK